MAQFPAPHGSSQPSIVTPVLDLIPLPIIVPQIWDKTQHTVDPCAFRASFLCVDSCVCEYMFICGSHVYTCTCEGQRVNLRGLRIAIHPWTLGGGFVFCFV